MSDTFACIVRADRLALAHAFTSTEETRYYLNGVNLRAVDGGVTLCATDGHVLGAFRDTEGHTSRDMIVMLPKAALKACGKPSRQNAMRLRSSSGDEWFPWFGIRADEPTCGPVFATIVDEADIDQARPLLERPRVAKWHGVVEIIDGTFPAYERVIPKTAPSFGAQASVSAHVLKRFFPVGNPVRVMLGKDSSEPALVTCSRADFIGVAMPMRDGHFRDKAGDFTAPIWALGTAVA